MSTKSELLKLLESNKGTYLSGEEMAGRLGCSRTAVWKAMKSLRDDGYKIKAVNNKGYVLDTDSDILSKEAIRLYLKNKEDLKNSQLQSSSFLPAAHGLYQIPERHRF